MMRDRIRGLFEHGLGVPGRAVLAWRTRAQAERLLQRRGAREDAAAIARDAHDVVRDGPFREMHYPRRFGDIVHAPKLLGSYEREVHGAIEALVGRRPDLVVNIGSGDGYYAVGLARRLRAATIVAVDPDPLAQRACRATAELNGVGGNVRPVVRLDARGLDRLLRDSGARHPLAVVDCEGFEDELLDPVAAPRLADCDMLAETHDFAREGVTARLLSRFAHTHRAERFEVLHRDPSAYPSLDAVAAERRPALLDEYRHLPQSWLALFARSHP